jgi:hypothetical protein
MKRTAVLAMALLFITSCAGMPMVKEGINYSGKWTGQSYIDAQQGMVDNFDLVLVHEGDVISGVISDDQGYMSNTQLSNVALNEKILTFSFIASTPMGNVQVDSTGTFSEDGEALELYFLVPELNISGSASLKKS